MKNTCKIKKTFSVPTTALCFKYLFTLLIGFASSAANAQSWVDVGGAGCSDSSASFLSIAIDIHNTPYITYEDNSTDYKATVMKFTGSEWVTVGIAGFSDGSAAYTSITTDGSGTPYVVYSDGSKDGKATVMKFNGSSWVAVGSTGFSVGGAASTAIAIDTSGTPYVVYYDVANSYKATVMKFNGSSWVTVGSAGFSSGVALFTSIAIDKSGEPYVVYEDGEDGPATVMKFDGSWVAVGGAGFSDSKALYTSIAVDGSGTPYVVYGDSGPDDAYSGAATVMKFNGSSWVIVGSAGFSPSWSYNTSIAIDKSGIPYVVFGDDADSQKAMVMKFDGSSWANVGIADFSAGGANSTSIVIDSAGIPYVVYQDESNGNKVTVMKYGYDEAVTTIKQQVSSINIYPNPNHGLFTLNISSPSNEDAAIVITNILGEKVKQFTATTNTNTEIQLNAPPGMYLINTVTTQGKQITKVEIW